jgi:hypothetical protein
MKQQGQCSDLGSRKMNGAHYLPVVTSALVILTCIIHVSPQQGLCNIICLITLKIISMIEVGGNNPAQRNLLNEKNNLEV